jgi:NAD(P)-dependent dehydrogenase (short-subunit alcohol dehydrogenase family)
MGMLNGKAVVITGSGRGIGAGCAKGVARQGAAVVVNDIDADPANEVVEAIRAAGGTAIACVADITNWDDAGRLIRSCIDAFGKIDGLVNNAALMDTVGVEQFDAELARAIIDVNVMGPLFCMGHAVKPMIAQGSGSIINVVSGAHLGMVNMGIYGASKGAAASMIYTWALELAGKGIRVNGLSPLGSTRLGNPSAETRAKMPAPENNSVIVEYLLSDRAAHVTGQIVRKDLSDIYLYTHPALLLPPVSRENWTAEELANVFDNEFRDRLVACGVLGMECLPVELKTGHNIRLKAV